MTNNNLVNLVDGSKHIKIIYGYIKDNQDQFGYFQ